MRLTALPRGAAVGPSSEAPGDLLAADTVRRCAEVAALPLRVVGVPAGWEDLNVHPSSAPGPAEHQVGGAVVPGSPPYRLEHRLAWLARSDLDEAADELARWRRLVAAWAEAPSRPMCAQVQEDLLGALVDGLATERAVAVLRGSLDLGLPPGCLFETWAWADRLLGLDLASDVGR